MAIVRTAGTEIIRSAHFGGVNNVAASLIIGVQHHIYTILSISMHCTARSGTQDGCLRLVGWNSFATGSENCVLARTAVAARATYVWNDKFSFNGYEPTGVSSAVSTAAEQDALADQGGSTLQRLQFYTDGASTAYDVSITYIDQNNA